MLFMLNPRLTDADIQKLFELRHEGIQENLRVLGDAIEKLPTQQMKIDALTKVLPLVLFPLW